MLTKYVLNLRMSVCISHRYKKSERETVERERENTVKSFFNSFDTDTEQWTHILPIDMQKGQHKIRVNLSSIALNEFDDANMKWRYITSSPRFSIRSELEILVQWSVILK